MDKTVGPEGVSYKFEDRYNLLEFCVSSSNVAPENTSFIWLMEKNYFWALKQHYLEGTGLDVFLTKDQFNTLMSHGKIDFSTVKLIDDDYFVANVSFYDSNLDLHLSFGTATVKFKMEDDRIEFYAFRDTFNFDPKPWGARGIVNELIVRTYNKLSNGTQFGIYYNKMLF